MVRKHKYLPVDLPVILFSRSCTCSYSIMEPQSTTPALQAQIAAATAALPPSHLSEPVEDEIVNSIDAGYLRIQDWVFTQGFAVVKESRKPTRQVLQCLHHHHDTRNTRKKAEDEWARAGTKTKAAGCKFTIYISQRKKEGGKWMIGWTHREHNHPMNLDPFTYVAHRDKRLGHSAAVAAALPMRGVISYEKVNRILQNQGLQLPKKEFCNLERQSGKGQLTKAEELTLLQEYLTADDFRVRLLEGYVVGDDSKPRERVIKAFAFTNSEMIRLGRRFVSEFGYIIDATFGTNKYRLPLLVCVGIDNTDTTFPFLLAYVVGESAEIFTFVNNILTELIFHDIPAPKVCIGDFAAGLRSARLDFNEQELAAAEAAERTAELCQLQACIWHVVEAIKAKLVRAGKYSKERRDELIGLVWAWANSETLAAADEKRGKLLAQFGAEEQRYLREYYQPKEDQFLQAYMKTYPHLGCNSTQRAEGTIPSLKRFVTAKHPYPPLSEASAITASSLLSSTTAGLTETEHRGPA